MLHTHGHSLSVYTACMCTQYMHVHVHSVQCLQIRSSGAKVYSGGEVGVWWDLGGEGGGLHYSPALLAL